MIGMDQYELIRTAHRVYGKSIRQISREYSHSRKTVRKALKGIEPKYQRTKAKVSPVIEPVKGVIDEWLLNDLKSPKKQRHTGIRIFNRLVEEHGFNGSDRTVRRYVRQRSAELGISRQEAMIPLCYQIGAEAEVDWGEAQAVIGGVKQRIKMFCMRSRYSGKSFVRAYPFERQAMFFEGHQYGFAFFGGVHRIIIYDNLSTAVRKVLKGKKRIEQDSFVSFRTYYTFEARFCNPGKGHEKGGVEGLVGYCRRNFLVPIPEVKDFDELNQKLVEQCQSHGEKILKHRGNQESIESLHQKELQHLLKIPTHPYSLVKLLPVKVDKYQTIRIDKNIYSVPNTFCGWQLNVHIDCWTIRIFDGQKEMAQHKRVFGKNQWILNPFHYLKTLFAKPGAFDSARPIQAWRNHWPKLYESTLSQLRERLGESKGTQEFIEILKLHQDYEDDKVLSALKQSAQSHAWGAASVKSLLILQNSVEHFLPPLEQNRIPGVTDLSISSTDLESFNALIKPTVSSQELHS